MRLLLAVALVLLFLWLYSAQTPRGPLDGRPCAATSTSRAAAWLLLSPLSLYSWLASTLLRAALAAPALLLSSLRHSLLLLLAGPWCAAAACVSALVAWLRVAVYLLHLALGFAAVAILVLARHKMADGDGGKKRMTRGCMELGHKVVQQG